MAPATSAPFAVGDQVFLNSGGPTMTVVGISRHGNVWCEWERTPGQWDEHSFPAPCLSRRRPAPPAGTT